MPFRKTINKVKAKIRKMGTTTYVRPYNPHENVVAKKKPTGTGKPNSRPSNGIGVGY